MMTYPPMKAVGPKPAAIMLVGEAPGVEEMMQGTPFVGASGKELKRMLRAAGINYEDCYATNVFFTRPADNKVENFCDQGSANAVPGYPAVFAGKYVNAIHRGELERLHHEIEAVNPTIICALGNVPSWAILRLGVPKITQLRGRLHFAEIAGRRIKVLPTFHPAYILRNWADRPTCIVDFRKLKRESYSPEANIPSRRILIDPTFEEMKSFFENYVFSAPRVTLDIETFQKQITVCGIAVGKSLGMVVPFVDFRKPTRSYWDSIPEEREAIKLFQKVCADPRINKVFQNGMYDMTYMFHLWKCRFQNLDDSMILQHAMWPEMLKGLGFLASIHTDEAAWKMMRKKNVDDIKRDE